MVMMVLKLCFGVMRMLTVRLLGMTIGHRFRAGEGTYSTEEVSGGGTSATEGWAYPTTFAGQSANYST